MLSPKATAPEGGISSDCGARLSLLCSGEDVVKKLWQDLTLYIQAWANDLNQSVPQFLVSKLWLKAFLSSLFQATLAVNPSGKKFVPQTSDLLGR